MINIAVVEDENTDADKLVGYLYAYSEKCGSGFGITRYADAVGFLSEREKCYDLVFMDIMMPNMNGMRAAGKFREFDKKAKLIFVTNMAKFAIKGYEVDAFDFLVKPINYPDFEMKMKKVVELIKSEVDDRVMISGSGSIKRLSVNSVYYIEVSDHKLLYHTYDGSFTIAGSLSATEEKFKAYGFLRCNSCYLLNPKHIDAVDGHTVTMVNGDRLQISHPRKKTFMEELAEWMGKGNFVK